MKNLYDTEKRLNDLLTERRENRKNIKYHKRYLLLASSAEAIKKENELTRQIHNALININQIKMRNMNH